MKRLALALLALLPGLCSAQALLVNGQPLLAGTQVIQLTGGPAPLNFPRLGGLFIAGSVQTYWGTTAFQQQIARLGIAVIGTYPGWTGGGFTMQSAAAAVKAINPSTKLFPYTNIMELQPGVGSSGSAYSPIFNAATTMNWFLRTAWPAGSITDADGNAQNGLNQTLFTVAGSGAYAGYANYLAWRAGWTAANEYPGSNWDGIYLDNVFYQPRVTADYNQSGSGQTASAAQANWQAGYVAYAGTGGYLRTALPAGTLLMGNSADWANGTVTAYSGMLDGPFIEGVTTYQSTWATQMATYKAAMVNTRTPTYAIYSQDGSVTNYQFMRYGFGEALLDNAYYYHSNNGTYDTVEWYDEFNFNLGAQAAGPAGSASATWSNGGLTVWKAQGPSGVWRRDFANGIVIVNPFGNGAQTVVVDASVNYWHILGTQSSPPNDGSEVLAGGTVTLADADAVILSRTAPGFDFYISPTGDDNNACTLAAPCSITWLGKSSAMSLYHGKRIGMLPGTYQYGTTGGAQTSIYSLSQAIAGGPGSNPGTNDAISVDGGTTSSPTYLASSDSSGHYSPRTAVIYPVDISTGNRSTSESGVIGQAYSALGSGVHVPHPGNLTIDGIVIHKWFQWAIAFYPQLAGTYPTAVNTGIRVQNCEIYDGVGNGNDNSSPVVFQAVSGAYLGNNKLHDHTKSAGTGDDIAAVYSFSSNSDVYEFNTIYNTGYGVYDKIDPNGNHTVRYNFIEATTGNTVPSPLQDGMGSQSGETYTVHHNILYTTGTNANFGAVWNGSGIHISAGNVVFYNNTAIYGTNAGTSGLFLQKFSGTFTSNYNNIVMSTITGTVPVLSVVASEYSGTEDYNIYDTSNHAPLLGSVTTPGSAMPTAVPLSTWQTNTGKDTHSAQATPTFAGSFGAQNAANYKPLNGSSPQVNFGHVGGTSGGGSVNAGAWDGTVTQIGANF